MAALVFEDQESLSLSRTDSGAQVGTVRTPATRRRVWAAACVLGLLAVAALVSSDAPALVSQSFGFSKLYTGVIPAKKRGGSKHVDEKKATKKKDDTPKKPTPVPFSPLLFCFSMVRATGYEPELVSAQYYNSAGVFACDEFKLYSNGGTVKIGPITTTEVVAPKSDMGDNAGATSSWLNTGTFLKAWDEVVKSGKWWSNDWTVKIDPDAVFFPHRLREQIAPHTKGLNAEALWVGNCDRVWHRSHPHLKLFGSLEIFNRNAMGTYKAFGKRCKEELPWQEWGEDLFMQQCMEKLYVKPLNGTSFLGDKRCYDAPCTDFTKIAFHDFKEVGPFFECWGASRGSEKVYGKTFAERQEEEAQAAKEAARREKQEMLEQEMQEKQRVADLERRVEEAKQQEKDLEARIEMLQSGEGVDEVFIRK